MLIGVRFSIRCYSKIDVRNKTKQFFVCNIYLYLSNYMKKAGRETKQKWSKMQTQFMHREFKSIIETQSRQRSV